MTVTYKVTVTFLDGDGVRTATLTTPYEDDEPQVEEAALTVYYFGGSYEISGLGEINDGIFEFTSVVSDKKYYSFGGQTMMRDANGLQYFLTDHLGSTVAVTDASGTLTSQQRYLPFGQVRTDVTSPNPQFPITDYGYTGQRDLDPGMGGLMDYKARFYSPVLGRFIQPDTITPNMTQDLNRYSYVFNNPLNYVDPSGHEPGDHCDRGYCDKDGNVIMANPLLSCRLDCKIDDLDKAKMEDRLEWFRWLTNHMDENFKDGTSDWFNNIDGIVDSFVLTGQDDNQWMLTVDANILIAVKDGYVAQLNNGDVYKDSGAALWKEFFYEFKRGVWSQNKLIGLWGRAEQAGTNEGYARADKAGYGGGEGWKLNWMTTDYGLDDILFSTIGDMYRGSGKTYCAKYSCAGEYNFFNPQAQWFGRSPVWYVALRVYRMDTFGYLITGH